MFFALLPAVLGLPPAGTLLFIALNTALIGLSEEWMFRGVLFQGLRSRLAMWPAILLTSLLFGAVHVLNVITTGQLLEAVVQSVAAFMSGMVLLALLIRTGSIWVPIAYHALWDFGTFVTSATSPKTAGTGGLHAGLDLGAAHPDRAAQLSLRALPAAQGPQRHPVVHRLRSVSGGRCRRCPCAVA